MGIIKKIIKVISRLALYALSIVMIVSNFKSCKETDEGKDNICVASAAELLEEDIQPISGDDWTTTVDVKNNITNISYLNIAGTRTAYTINLCFYYLENFPKNFDVTIEAVNTNQNQNVYASFLIYAPDGDMIYRLRDDVEHITVKKEDLQKGTSFAYVIQTTQPNTEQTYNFSLYAYYGNYVPGFAQGVQAGYTQGYGDGVKSTSEVLITEGNSNYATSAGNIYTYMVADENSIKFQTTNHLGYVTLRLNSRLANGQKILISYDSLDHDIAFCVINSFGQGISQIFSIPASETSKTVEVILNIDGIYGTSSDIREFEIQNFVGSVPSTPVPITTITGLKIMAAPTGEAYYDNGYKNGFKDGETSGLTKGEQIGYEKAISENLNNAGIFSGLIAVLKLIFDLIADFMAKPIAGNITFGLIFVGLPATFGLISMTINLVKKFVGGGGGDSDG